GNQGNLAASTGLHSVTLDDGKMSQEISEFFSLKVEFVILIQYAFFLSNSANCSSRSSSCLVCLCVCAARARLYLYVCVCAWRGRLYLCVCVCAARVRLYLCVCVCAALQSAPRMVQVPPAGDHNTLQRRL